MSRYDGLIIPRSYSEYINKTDAATLQQALQLSGVLSGAVAAGDNKAVKSDAVNEAIKSFYKIITLPVVGSTTRYDSIEGLFPDLGADTNAYIISLRNGETHLLICGTSDGSAPVTPIWIQLSGGVGKLTGISYDQTTKKIVLKRSTYTATRIIQITGLAATLIINQTTEELGNRVTKKIITYS